MDISVSKVEKKPTLLQLLSAVMFFAVAVVQLVSLIVDLSKSYRDTMRWGGLSAVILFCSFAFVIILCLAMAAIIFLQKNYRHLGTVLKIYAGIELMFCIYSILKDLDISGEAVVWMFVLETVFFVLALISLCALLSIKGEECSTLKCVFAVAAPVFTVISIVFSIIRYNSLYFTYIDSQFATVAILFVTPILLAIAFATVGLSSVLPKKAK